MLRFFVIFFPVCLDDTLWHRFVTRYEHLRCSSPADKTSWPSLFVTCRGLRRSFHWTTRYGQVHALSRLVEMSSLKKKKRKLSSVFFFSVWFSTLSVFQTSPPISSPSSAEQWRLRITVLSVRNSVGTSVENIRGTPIAGYHRTSQVCHKNTHKCAHWHIPAHANKQLTSQVPQDDLLQLFHAQYSKCN